MNDLPPRRGKKPVRTLGFALVWTGILLGMVIFGVLVSQHLEASFYFGYGVPADQPLRTLRCPVLLTTRESGVIGVALKNPGSQPISPQVRFEVSNHYGIRTLLSKPSIAPGETRPLYWTVTSDDVMFGNFIMVKVYAFSAPSFPSRLAQCGIFVLNLPFTTSRLVAAVMLALCWICLGSGAWLWVRANRPLDGRVKSGTTGLFVVISMVLVGMVLGALRLWAPGVFLFALTVLLITVIATYFYQPG